MRTIGAIAAAVALVMGGSSASNAATDDGVLPPPPVGGGWVGGGGHIFAGVRIGGRPGGPGGADGSGCRWFSDVGGITGSPGKPQPGEYRDGVLYRLFVRVCGVSSSLVWVPEGSPRVLLAPLRAMVVDRAHAPTFGLQPWSMGQAVNVGTWFWTSPESFTSVSTPDAWVPTPNGIAWARATATPIRLSFDPGDGQSVASCSHAGVVTEWAAYWQETPSGSCRFESYRRAGEVTATMSITWRVTWDGNVGDGGGVLGEFATEVSAPVRVEEYQALIVG